MRIFCLLPVRNGAHLLRRYMASASQFCDGVIALDDGSTDETGAFLEAAPLVQSIISNPVRNTFEGWDDSKNRSMLLEECARFAPDWVLWMDADEEIVACDAALLRRFVETCIPECAYGLEVLRLIGDHRRYDLAKLWVYRLIPYRSGYELPHERLHFEPVPLQIPRQNWRRSRLRIAHSGGMTSSLRQARFAKYREADPRLEWQDSYDDILAPPGHLWEIKPLPEDVGLLIAEPERVNRGEC